MLGQRRRCLPLAFLAAALALAGVGTRGVGQNPAEQQPPPAVWKLDAPFTQTWATVVTQTTSAGDIATETKRTVTTKVTWVPKADQMPEAKEKAFDLTITSVEVTGEFGPAAARRPGKAPEDKMKGAKVAVTLTPQETGLKVTLTQAADAATKLSDAEKKDLERTIAAAFPDLKGKASKAEFESAAGKYTTDTTWKYKDAKEKKSSYTGESKWEFKAKPDAAVKVPDHKLVLAGTLTFNTETGLAEVIKLDTPQTTAAVKVNEVEVKTSYSLTITTKAGKE